MLDFKLVLPNGKIARSNVKSEFQPKLNGNPIRDKEELARYIWSQFKSWQNVKTLEQWKTEWAELMTENSAGDGGNDVYEGENVSIEEAFDHCGNNFILNIDGSHVSISDFLSKHLPEEKRK